MVDLVQIGVIFGGIVMIFLLLVAIQHVLRTHWLPAVERVELDEDEGDGGTE